MSQLQEFLKKADQVAPASDDLSPELLAYFQQKHDQLFFQPFVKGEIFTVIDVLKITETVKDMTGVDPVSFSELEVTFDRSNISCMASIAGNISFLLAVRKRLEPLLSVKLLASTTRPLEDF